MAGPPPPKGGGVWVGRSDLQVGLVLDMALCLYYWGGVEIYLSRIFIKCGMVVSYFLISNEDRTRGKRPKRGS